MTEGSKISIRIKGMWHLRRGESSCEQLGPVSTCLCTKYTKFCFQNLGNGREDNRHRLLLVLTMKKNIPIYLAKIEFFFQFRNQK